MKIFISDPIQDDHLCLKNSKEKGSERVAGLSPSPNTTMPSLLFYSVTLWAILHYASLFLKDTTSDGLFIVLRYSIRLAISDTIKLARSYHSMIDGPQCSGIIVAI